MNIKTKSIAVMILSILLPSISAFGQTHKPKENTQSARITEDPVVQKLSDSEIEGILQMREEEKLARDVYYTFYRKWQLPIFANIAQAEQRHMNAMKQLIQNYKLDDPVQSDTIGQFTNPELTALYQDLVQQGSVSLLDALKTGAYIEELDIADLRTISKQTQFSDILFVYENLKRGSRNHLRAFSSQIRSRGESYQARYLTQVEFDQIAQSAQEKGPGARIQGRERGQGRNFSSGMSWRRGEGRGQGFGRNRGQGGRMGQGRGFDRGQGYRWGLQCRQGWGPGWNGPCNTAP